MESAAPDGVRQNLRWMKAPSKSSGDGPHDGRAMQRRQTRPAPEMAEGALVALHSCIRRHVSGDLWYLSDMTNLDLNLLAPLDVLLTEGSVVGAARRLRL